MGGGVSWNKSVGITTSLPRNNMLGVTPVLECLAPLYSMTVVLSNFTKLLSPSDLIKLLI